MNEPLQRLTYLFERYYYKTATPEEVEELFSIINTGLYDDALLSLMHRLWNEEGTGITDIDSLSPEQILTNIFEVDAAANAYTVSKIAPGRIWPKVLAAASVLLFIGLIWYFFQFHQITSKNPLVVKRNCSRHDASPGRNRAFLQLGNGKTILLDTANNGVLAKQGLVAIKKTANGQLMYQYAKTKSGLSATNLISTPNGGQYQVTLSDGTKVWLNAASSIKFPACFTGNHRQVQITGEVYFEVAKDPAKPFEVFTNRGNIRVLGTHFNIMDYDDESKMKTTLLEGAVNIQNNGFDARLKPGQQAVSQSTGPVSVVDNVDIEDEIAWKEDVFQFNDAGVDAVMRQMARWYNLKPVYHSHIPTKQFTGHISRNVKASQLITMLKYSGINLHIDGGSLILDQSN